MTTPHVGAIVLAAGESRRMGAQKVLLPFAGRTVLEHIIGEIRAGGIADVIVVTGKDADAVEARHATSGVILAHNADYADGMLSSVRTGLRAMPETWAAACIALGDQPAIRRETVSTLLEIYRGEPSRIVRPTHDGRGGHPVIVPVAFVPEILADFDDMGLRGLFARHASRVHDVPLDEGGVLRDIDYPEDYRREMELFERSGG